MASSNIKMSFFLLCFWLFVFFPCWHCILFNNAWKQEFRFRDVNIMIRGEQISVWNCYLRFQLVNLLHIKGRFALKNLHPNSLPDKLSQTKNVHDKGKIFFVTCGRLMTTWSGRDGKILIEWDNIPWFGLNQIFIAFTWGSNKSICCIWIILPKENAVQQNCYLLPILHIFLLHFKIYIFKLHFS